MLISVGILARKCCSSVLILTSLFLIYKCFGTLFGTFRTDEIYFLQDSWSYYKGYLEPYGAPLQLRHLLKLYWMTVDGDVSSVWILRIVVIILVIIQAWIVSKMASAIFPNSTPLISQVKVLIAASYVTVMCAYRGYEIRPEVIPNTLVLLSTYWLFFYEKGNESRNIATFRLATVGFALIFSASMSFRYALPAVIYIFFAAREISDLGEKRINLSVLIVGMFWAMFALYLNDSVIKSIAFARAYQENRVAFSMLDRFTIGGGIHHLYAKLAIFASLLYLAVKVVRESGRLMYRNLTLATPFVALLAFYFFLFLFDVQPYQYVRSVEWTFMVIVLFITLRDTKWKKNIVSMGTFSALIIGVSLVVIVKEAINNVDQQRNSSVALSQLADIRSKDVLKTASDLELVELSTLWVNGSVINQVRARSEYCKRYPDGLALVHTFIYHPICLRDAGSLALSGWRGSVDLGEIDFSQLKWFSLSHDQRKIVDDRVRNVKSVGDIYLSAEIYSN